MKLSVHIALLGFLLESSSLAAAYPASGFGFHFKAFKPSPWKLGETAMSSSSGHRGQHGALSGPNICRTHSTPEERASSERKVRAKHGHGRDDGQKIVFPVNFHVVAENKTWEGGWIRHHQIRAQLEVLNKDFIHANIHFELHKVTHTISQHYFKSGGIDPKRDLELQHKLRLGGADSLNIYSSGFLEGGAEESLGRATYPWQHEHHGLASDGVSIKWTTLPGFDNDREYEGKVLTHQVGHWLGLYHTFEGESCDGKGDEVDDTPPQAKYSYACGVLENSCPIPHGHDVKHSGTNFMDLKPDSCMREFTPGQVRRMREHAKIFRLGQ